MIRLARRETVPYLRQTRFKRSPWCAPQDGQRVAAVTEAAVERSSWSGVVVVHTRILSPVIGAGLVLSAMGITSAKQQLQLAFLETSHQIAIPLSTTRQQHVSILHCLHAVM